MDRDELEEELWRLRSVEYDLEKSQELLKRAVGTAENAAEIAKHEQERNQPLADKIEELNKVVFKQKEHINQLIEEAKTKDHQIGHLRTALEKYQRHEYYSETYGFEITDKIPSKGKAKRRGWRLSQ